MFPNVYFKSFNELKACTEIDKIKKFKIKYERETLPCEVGEFLFKKLYYKKHISCAITSIIKPYCNKICRDYIMRSCFDSYDIINFNEQNLLSEIPFIKELNKICPILCGEFVENVISYNIKLLTNNKDLFCQPRMMRNYFYFKMPHRQFIEFYQIKEYEDKTYKFIYFCKIPSDLINNDMIITGDKIVDNFLLIKICGVSGYIDMFNLNTYYDDHVCNKSPCSYDFMDESYSCDHKLMSPVCIYQSALKLNTYTHNLKDVLLDILIMTVRYKTRIGFPPSQESFDNLYKYIELYDFTVFVHQITDICNIIINDKKDIKNSIVMRYTDKKFGVNGVIDIIADDEIYDIKCCKRNNNVYYFLQLLSYAALYYVIFNKKINKIHVINLYLGLHISYDISYLTSENFESFANLLLTM